MHKESVEVSFIVNGVIMKEIVEAINKLGETNCIDYVQLVATVVSVIISAIAVIYAVKVPKKIAEEQNRIALFEKRYSLYVDFTKVLAVVKIFETNEIKTKNEGILEFVNFVGDNDFSDQDSGLVQAKAKSILIKTVEKLGQIGYLFELKSDELIEDYCKSLIAMVKAENDNEFLKCLEESKKLFNEINEQMLPILESYLHI